MKKSLFILLLTLLTALTLTASAAAALPVSLTEIDDNAFEGDASLTGRVVLPAAVKTVGSRAFADTSLHALVVPAGCTSIDGSVLAGTDAAYLQLNGTSTAISGSVTGVTYVFGPAFGSASSLDHFYANETLVTEGGFYYSVTEGTATPLCAVDSGVTGEVKLPKLISGQPLRALDTLILNGCEGVTSLAVPAYLDIPSHLSASTYATMTATAPAASAASANVGETLTWTTSVTGAYGETSYLWTFTTGSNSESLITTIPTVEYTLKSAGTCTVTVKVTDEVNDSASATSAGISVNGADPVYRALLVCNTYSGTSNELPGPSNDVSGMRSMLGQMSSTAYRVSTRSELSSSGIISAIRTAFAGATVNDVSLFYFSGHGTNAIGTSYHGALLGTGGTYLTVAQLKSVLDEIPGKKIVIVDTCHSGQLIGKSSDSSASVSTAELNAFNSSVVSTFSAGTVARGENDLANSGYYVITAAHSTEESFSMGYDANNDGTMDKYFGIFTYSLCYGSGWNMARNSTTSLFADADSNGEITLYEAYAYARSKAQQSHPYQTAQIYPANSSMVIWAK